MIEEYRPAINGDKHQMDVCYRKKSLANDRSSQSDSNIWAPEQQKGVVKVSIRVD